MRLGFWLPCAAVAVLGAAACSLAIGASELGAVQCEQEGQQGPPACDEGQICLNGVCTGCEGSGACGLGSGGQGGGGGAAQGGGPGQGGSGGTGVEAGGGSEAGPDTSLGGASGTGGAPPTGGSGGEPPEVGPEVLDEPAADAPEPAKALGEKCSVDDDCESRFCVDNVGALPGKACTRACCSSGECGPGYFCHPLNTYSVCVSTQRVAEQPGPNAGQLGADCALDKDCASLRCRDGKCSDACCVDGDCLTTVCAYDWGAKGWFCNQKAPGTSGSDSETCTGNGSCDGNNCVVGFCGAPCCGDADCPGMLPKRYCKAIVDLTTATYVRSCGFSDGPDLCCNDDDCASKGLKCLPADEGGVLVLRCQ